jgi:hypothetical protein
VWRRMLDSQPDCAIRADHRGRSRRCARQARRAAGLYRQYRHPCRQRAPKRSLDPLRRGQGGPAPRDAAAGPVAAGRPSASTAWRPVWSRRR